MALHALITGGSSGIGFAYAQHLNRSGWQLSLAAQSAQRLSAAKKQLGPSAQIYPVNLAAPLDVGQLIEMVEVPDLLIANAGITRSGAVGSISQPESAALQYLLCGGIIDLVQWAAPIMKARGSGRIVIISSIAAETPMPKSSIYASAKTGVTAYGRSIHRELKPFGVNVTVSLPGYVRTNLHAKAGLDHLIRQIPSWMWLEPDTVVAETEKASLANREIVIPGRVYRMTRPFLGSRLADNTWRRLTRRRPRT
ncbi:MAG: SDR family NAD(P)-dependent oxidoreductase [Pseudomonadales bacterium]|jgi:short-subunit dehydrogenase|nr:SDR family NAD(P)-dependent oxidoreductase [Pseudomonadales bacterium]MDA0761320.1 SDR family NAD(P)-dependent oxidoreductase [Pseudomonadota bacterium]MDA0958424.1 SDR family NAD(P)-dependent oxidoreductase [Pseudomonadota bacterium]